MMPENNKNASSKYTENAGSFQKQARDQIVQVLIENSYDMLGLLDENFCYLFLSQAANEAYDGEANSIAEFQNSGLLGRNCFDSVHPEDRPVALAQFQLLFQGQKKVQIKPYRVQTAEGGWIWLEAIVTNQLNHPDIGAIVVSARNVTHQIETGIKLKELLLMEALMEGEEKERNRIARDLHDEISGMIAAAKMQFEALGNKLHEAPALKEFVQGMDLLGKAARQVRATSHNLMPEILLENGLREALRRYCSSISHDNFNINFLCIGEIGRFSAGFELSLYRIAQELVGNIIKHSKATEAFIQLSMQQNLLSVTVEDNGIGFNASQSTKGTGLKSVQKRVEAMNGSMELCTEPDKGTSIYLEFEKLVQVS